MQYSPSSLRHNGYSGYSIACISLAESMAAPSVTYSSSDFVSSYCADFPDKCGVDTNASPFSRNRGVDSIWFRHFTETRLRTLQLSILTNINLACPPAALIQTVKSLFYILCGLSRQMRGRHERIAFLAQSSCRQYLVQTFHRNETPHSTTEYTDEST